MSRKEERGWHREVSSLARPDTYHDLELCRLAAIGDVGMLAQRIAISHPKPDLNSADPQGKTALYFAALRGHTEVVRFLLLQGADPNLKCLNGTSPMHAAALGKSDASVIVLLAYKADPDAVDQHNRTPLIISTHIDHHASVKAIIAAGANLDIQEHSQGNAALHVAAIYGRRKIFCDLISMGADPNLKNRLGDTPLHILAKKGCFFEVSMLLSAGADRAIKNAAGMTATDIVKAQGKGRSTLQILEKRC